MSFVDPIGDMITRIRNAQMRALSKVSIPNSKLRSRILDREIFLKDQERAKDRKSQVGSGDRSERIRTYNFPQGRILRFYPEIHSIPYYELWSCLHLP